MKSRNSRANSGYVGQNRLSDDYGVISENKNYLRSNLTQWIRPANWLPLPSMTAGDQMFAGLLAVYPGDPALTGPTASGNFVAFSVTGCTYTVDWGNGTTQSYSAGVTAQYNFDFGSISAATSVTGVEGLSGYRQTVIKAYPTVAGTTFSGIDLAGKYSQAGYTFGSAWSPAWLDMRIAGSTISSFKFFIPNSGVSNNIEQFEWVGNSGITNGTSFFSSNSSGIAGCKNLKSLIGTSWTSNIINFTSMFSACKILRTIPLLNTASGTNFTSMFANCSSLQTVPLLNTASGTIFTGMFNSCRNLQTIPPLNLTSGTDFSTMFASCESLQTIPLLNTANGTNFNSMFSGCSNLQTIPLLNTAKGTSISSMFRFCNSLQTIPLLDFRAAQTFNLVFDGCNNLKQAATQIPAINSPWSVSGNNLSPAAINQIFTKLPTGAAFVRTCEITNNWGAAGCDKSIATAKGWNVK